MTHWFARPVLHVIDVEASIRFYADRLGFSVPWRFGEGGATFVAQVERQGCALLLSNQWPEKVGKGLVFVSLNVEPETPEALVAALDALRVELEARARRSGRPVGLPAPGGRRSRRQSDLFQLSERTGGRRCSSALEPSEQIERRAHHDAERRLPRVRPDREGDEHPQEHVGLGDPEAVGEARVG